MQKLHYLIWASAAGLVICMVLDGTFQVVVQSIRRVGECVSAMIRRIKDHIFDHETSHPHAPPTCTDQELNLESTPDEGCRRSANSTVSPPTHRSEPTAMGHAAMDSFRWTSNTLEP